MITMCHAIGAFDDKFNWVIWVNPVVLGQRRHHFQARCATVAQQDEEDLDATPLPTPPPQ
jgi:hypothetical protein